MNLCTDQFRLSGTTQISEFFLVLCGPFGHPMAMLPLISLPLQMGPRPNRQHPTLDLPLFSFEWDTSYCSKHPLIHPRVPFCKTHLSLVFYTGPNRMCLRRCMTEESNKRTLHLHSGEVPHHLKSTSWSGMRYPTPWAFRVLVPRLVFLQPGDKIILPYACPLILV